MSQEEKAAYEQENTFTYLTIDEFVEDVVEWLRLSPWHYSETDAREIVKDREDWIIECFECHVPIDLAGAEAGYFCG